MSTPGFVESYFEVGSIDGEVDWLLKDHHYNSLDSTNYILPKNALSDGASIPRALRNIFNFSGRYWRAAYLHDLCYRNTLMKLDHVKCSVVLADLSFSQSNELFKEAMTSLKDGELTIDILDEAVCLFGEIAFNNDRAKGREYWIYPGSGIPKNTKWDKVVI